MKKLVLKASALLVILSTVACKDEHGHDHAKLQLDENNLIVAQDKVSHEHTEDTNKPKLKPEEYPKVDFEDKAPEYDFGTINEGDKVKHSFKFKNIGGTDLVIAHAQASCGCTVPEWTKTPIKPGESGEINIQFDSKGKPGIQSKVVTLTTNTQEGHEFIKFKANVTPKSK